MIQRRLTVNFEERLIVHDANVRSVLRSHVLIVRIHQDGRLRVIFS